MRFSRTIRLVSGFGTLEAEESSRLSPAMEVVVNRLKLTLNRSTIGITADQKATVRGLGLGKIRSTSELENTPAVRGMVKKVIHLLDVEEFEG